MMRLNMRKMNPYVGTPLFYSLVGWVTIVFFIQSPIRETMQLNFVFSSAVSLTLSKRSGKQAKEY